MSDEALRDASVRSQIAMLNMTIALLEAGLISDVALITVPSDGSPASASFIDPPTRTGDLLAMMDEAMHWVKKASEMQGSGHEELLKRQIEKITVRADKALQG